MLGMDITPPASAAELREVRFRCVGEQRNDNYGTTRRYQVDLVRALDPLPPLQSCDQRRLQSLLSRMLLIVTGSDCVTCSLDRMDLEV